MKHSPDLERSRRFDIAVIGAGPAGVAAAVRVRWLKRYHMAPCKVALIDSCDIGGLTQMGTTNLTGPGWFYNSEEMTALLRRDIAALHIPHFRMKARAVAAIAEGGYKVRLNDGASVCAEAVILCTGMRCLSGEPAFWRRGLNATSLGAKPSAEKLARWVGDPDYKSVVLVGTQSLLNNIPFLEGRAHANCRIDVVIEPSAASSPAVDASFLSSAVRIHRGTVTRLTGGDRLETIEIALEDGTTAVLNGIDLMVIDFMSLETNPAVSLAVPGLVRDAAGFIAVDRTQRTNLPGLFAAGDATGMPAAVSTALGDGVKAGFSAYRYVYENKFGAPPTLFAYFGYDRPLSDIPRDLPDYAPDKFCVELLTPPADASRSLTETTNSADGAGTEEFLDLAARHLSVAEINRRMDEPIEATLQRVDRLLIAKLATLTAAPACCGSRHAASTKTKAIRPRPLFTNSQ